MIKMELNHICKASLHIPNIKDMSQTNFHKSFDLQTFYVVYISTTLHSIFQFLAILILLLPVSMIQCRESPA